MISLQLETLTVNIPDPELAQLLELSTEDLRFCDYLTAVVENSTETLGKLLSYVGIIMIKIE